MTCSRILDQTLRAVAADRADPDAVAAGFRYPRRAPIDDHESVEHPVSAVLVRMVMVIVMMLMPVIAATHVMMMRLLRHSGLLFVTDDPGAIFAQLTIHAGVAAVELRADLSLAGEGLKGRANLTRRRRFATSSADGGCSSGG